jgi:predicted enzyme related to lactoylglutathione lyase
VPLVQEDIVTVRVEAILLETTRLKALSDFYRIGLQLDEPATLEPDQVGFQIGEVYLGLEQVNEAVSPSRAMSLWFKVDDARAVYERLLANGATTKDAPEEVDDEVIASVFDPDGNAIGLLSDIPPA